MGKSTWSRVPYRAHATAHVRAWDPPRLLEYDLRGVPGGNLPESLDGMIRWELTPQAGGTLLILTFRGLPKPVATAFAGGAKGVLDRLEAQLDGRPVPDWRLRPA